MFDTGTANALQIISLPAEFLGFCLAMVEIRFQNLAHFLRESIVGSRDQFDKNFFRGWQDNINARGGYAKVFGDVKSMTVLLLIVVATGFLIYVEEMEPVLVMLFILFVIVITVVAFSFGAVARLVLRSLVRFASTFAPGREIGALGLVIAFLGLMAESYQFAEVVSSSARVGGNIVAGSLLGAGLFILALGYFALIFGALQHRFDPERNWVRVPKDLR